MACEKSSQTTNLNNPEDFSEELLEQASLPTEAPVSRTCRVEHLKAVLETCIVENLISLLYQKVKQNCMGCFLDDPSQKHHDCLCTTRQDWVDYYGETAMEELNFHLVMQSWYPELNRIHLSKEEVTEVYTIWRSIKEDFQTKRSDPSWRKEWEVKILKAK